MLSKYRKNRGLQKKVVIKTIIALFSVIVIMAGTLTVSFANEDLNAVLTKWFDEKRMNAIVHIKEAVSTEKDAQKVRLKEELKKEMAIAESELNQFTDAEKSRRIQNLREYTDQLIGQINIDNASAEQQLVNQLNSIYAEAQNAMNTANTNWKSSVAPITKEEPATPQEEVGPSDPISSPALPEEAQPSEPIEKPGMEEPVQKSEPPAEEAPITTPLPPEELLEDGGETSAGDGE